jgi:hypothetical protein
MIAKTLAPNLREWTRIKSEEADSCHSREFAAQSLFLAIEIPRFAREVYTELFRLSCSCFRSSRRRPASS